MRLKNILVHLDQGPHGPDRLRLAVGLARTHGARLTGLFGQCGRAHMVGMVASWPSPAYAAAAEASRAAFAQTAGDLPEAVWRDANRGSATEVLRVVAQTARAFDLTILGQDTEDSPAPDGLAEHVLMESGRPCLILPYAGRAETVGRRPLIAWNHSREAARALNDALPLMQGCEEAVVVGMAGDDAEAERLAAADCLTHLAAHGIPARSEVLAVDQIGVMDMLLNRVVDDGADLLVMGGHGHTGLAFRTRQGGTRHILAHMTVPVLMSH